MIDLLTNIQERNKAIREHLEKRVVLSVQNIISFNLSDADDLRTALDSYFQLEKKLNHTEKEKEAFKYMFENRQSDYNSVVFNQHKMAALIKDLEEENEELKRELQILKSKEQINF